MSILPKLRFWESVLEEQNEKDNTCPKCGIKVYKSVLRMRGRNWHTACFTCTNCNKVLNLTTFTEVNNDIFCSECYAECFARRWRCSEIIDSRRLSKQLKNAVMEGQRFRWLPPKALSHSEGLDSEDMSTPSPKSETPNAFADSGCKTDDAIENSCTVNEGDSDPSEDEPVRGRKQTYSSADRLAINRFSNPRTLAERRSMRQAKYRMVQSEGIPEPIRFDPYEPIRERSEETPDEEVKVVEVRLRANDSPKPSNDPDASGQTSDEQRHSIIYSIQETSEDSEGSASAGPQPESSSSEERPPTPPPKPQRFRKSSAVSARSVLGIEGAQDLIPRGSPRTRPASAHFIRRSRFPSDHRGDVLLPNQHV